MTYDGTRVDVAGLGDLTFGTSGLGLGTVPGSPEEAAAVETAIALLRSGAFVDTANMYAGGRSEEIIGLGLASLSPAERAAAVDRVVTKTDRDLETGAFDADQVLRSHEQSLIRLGIDRVRWLHLHDPYAIPFAEAQAPGGVIDAMVRIRDEGATDAIGIAAGRTPVVSAFVDTGAFDMVLSHNRHTLVDRSAAGLFENARRRGMTTFNAAPFGGDLLAKGSAEGSSYAYRPVTAELRAWTADVERICASFDVPLAAVALQFSLRSPLIDSTVVTATSPARVAQIRELAVLPIPESIWTTLSESAPAPTPIDDRARDRS